MKRRDFIKYGSQLGLAGYISGLMNSPLFAQQAPRFKYFVYCHFDAGWDVTLATDPQVKKLQLSDKALFLGYREDEIQSALGIKFGPGAYGLKTYVANTVVINGVSMLGNVSHPDCARWANTGILERRTAGMAAMSAASASSEKTATVLSDSNDIDPGFLPVSSTYSGNVSNLESSTGPRLFLDETSEAAEGYRTTAKYSAAFKKAAEQFPEIKALLQNTNNPDSSDQFIGGTVLSFLSGYTNAAQCMFRVSGNNNLDTHNNHAAQHTPVLKAYFEQVFALIKALQGVPSGGSGRSMFDETLIVISSDFSREINLNGNSLVTSGKEHNGYTNSYILMSGGLRGGYTIGESVIQANALNRPAIHMARNFNFATGRPINVRADAAEFMDDKKAIKQIRPGHVVRSVASLMGFEDLLDPTLASLPKLGIG